MPRDRWNIARLPNNPLFLEIEACSQAQSVELKPSVRENSRLPNIRPINRLPLKQPPPTGLIHRASALK